MCDILCQFYIIVDYFLGFTPWRFPLFRGFYHVISSVIIFLPSYSLQIDLVIHLHFHFPKVGIVTYLLLLLCGLAQLLKLLIYISMDWHSHPTDYNFEDWHCHPSVHLISYGLALPPNCCKQLQWIGDKLICAM